MKYFISDKQDGKSIGEIILYEEQVTEPKRGKTIALVVGHDADEQGAYGDKGVSEWRFNTELLGDITLPPQHDIYIMFRNSEINGYSAQMRDLHERIDDLDCDIAVEFHFNSFHKPEANGNEVLYCRGSDGGEHWARHLDACLDVLDNRDRGVKPVSGNDRGAGFCCRGKSAAIICEPFFGSHQHRFVVGGDMREPLVKAIETFLERV